MSKKKTKKRVYKPVFVKDFYVIKVKADNTQLVHPEPETNGFKIGSGVYGAFASELKTESGLCKQLNEKFNNIFELVNTNKYFK